MPASNSKMRMGLGDFLALHQLAPDREEFIGERVPFGVIEEHAVAFEFDGIAARNDVDKQAAVRKAVERRGHPSGECRLSQPRTHRNQKPQALRDWRHGRGDDPGILA